MKVGIIGFGNMGRAIGSGLVTSDEYSVSYFDLLLKDNIEGFTRENDLCELVDNNDVIIFAIKPNKFDEVLNDIKVRDKNKIFVSIAAGISIDFISNILGEDTKIVRVMPNTPALVNEGASALCFNNNVNEEEKESIINIFSLIGKTCEIVENNMEVFTACCGSAPAYVYLFAKHIINFGVANGLSEEDSRRMVAQTILGSAKLLDKSTEEVDKLVSNVCSPGGTTIEAVNVFNEGAFEKVMNKALKSCLDKAIYLKNNS